jgi:hypothetical protein
MNETLLYKLYNKYNLSSKGDFNTFKNDMANPTVRQNFFNKYNLSSKGDYSTFESDLLGTNTQNLQQPVTPPVTQQTNESEKNAFAQQIEITPTKIENLKKNKGDNHITEIVFFLLFLFIALYFFHKRK